MKKQEKEKIEEEASKIDVTPAKEEVKETPKEEMIEVKKSDFDKMLSQMEKQSKDIDLLYKAADKSRISKLMNDGSEVLVKTAKVSTWDGGPFVIGWKLVSDKSEVVNGRWIEEQTVNIILEDGEVVTVPLLEFYRKTLKKTVGDIISKSEQYDSQNNKITLFKIQFPNGKILEINNSFVN